MSAGPPQIGVKRIGAIHALSAGTAVLTAQSVERDHLVFTVDAGGAVRTARATSEWPLAAAAGGESVFLILAETKTSSVRIAKLSADLESIWTVGLRSAAAPAPFARNACALRDGGVVLAGEFMKEAFVTRLGPDGAHAWTRVLDDVTGKDTFDSVVELRDGSIVAGGTSGQQHWLAKLSAQGEPEWQYAFDAGPVDPQFHSVIETRSGDVVAAGAAVVVRISSAGHMVWRASIESMAAPANVRTVVESADGTLVVAGGEHLIALSQDGKAKWLKKLAIGKGFRLMSGPGETDLVTAGNTVVYAPHLESSEAGDQRNGARIYEFNAEQEPTCPAFEPSTLQVVSSSEGPRVALVTASTRTLISEPRSFESREVSVAIESSSCGPVARVPARPQPAMRRVNPYDSREAARAQATAWREALEKKDFAALEKLGVELRKRRWTTDPLHWEIDRFYAALGYIDAQTETRTLATLREWLAAYPKSIAAHIALSTALQNTAWLRRGRGYIDTVKPEDYAAYRALLVQSQSALEGVAGIEADPVYWSLRIQHTAQLGDGDLRAVMRAAAKHTADPEAFLMAATYSLPRWGGSTAQYLDVADEAGRLTSATLGDGVYAWIVYQTPWVVGDGVVDDRKIDWPRAQKGFRDLIAAAPGLVTTYHRLARTAVRFGDRRLARELFARPELDWYTDASAIWSDAVYHRLAEQWAVARPAEAFVDSPPSVAPWPQIVMEAQASVAGGEPRRVAAFALQGPDGVDVLTAMPSSAAAAANWKIWSPSDPARKMDATPRREPAAPNRNAVRLTPSGPLSVRALTRASGEREPVELAYVVACEWSSTGCRQTVVIGNVSGWTATAGYTIALAEEVDVASLAGGALLDSNGRVLGIMSGRTEKSQEGSAQFAIAEDVNSVVPDR